MAKQFNARKALRNEESFYRDIEKVLNHIFYEIIYRPIIAIINEEIGSGWSEIEAPKVVRERELQKKDDLKEEIRRNKEVIPEGLRTNAKEKTPLIKAILSGKVQYINNHFEGKFSSSISKEIRQMGGRWDSRRKSWSIPSNKLSYDVQTAIGQVADKMIKVSNRINEHLNTIQEIVKENPNFGLERYFVDTIDKLDERFRDGLEKIIVAPNLTEEEKQNLAREYTNNMNLYINGWMDDSIVRLRKRVQRNAFDGYRSSQLVKEIEHDYQVSHNKARFLARQETSLLMSQFREERYKSVGVEKYRWSTSGDQRVRPFHKRLNGRVFTWDNPPIVDENGRRAHPGQDFGCRCIAIPIID